MINAYMTIDGVEGPSTSKAKAIDILTFEFGAEQTATYQAGSSGNEAKAGRANVKNLRFKKVLDKTSPLLFDHCVTGDILKEVTLAYDKPVKDAQQDYFQIVMTDALITSVALSGESDTPTETISMAFQKIKVCYAPEKDDGSLDGMVCKGFDMTTLKPF
ncbi:MAG: Hcp family type VI secretion system effector [Bryobacteraceae bacterium]